MTRALVAVFVVLACGACAGPRRSSGDDLKMPTLQQRLQDLAAAGTVVVAHRGDSAHAPENTLVAFARANAVGVGMIEFDVRQLGDGTLVCIHDATLDRTTNADEMSGRKGLRTADLAFGEVQRFDAGSWKAEDYAGERVPTLEAGLRTIQAGSVAMIEHKDGDPAAYVALLRRLGLVDDVLLQSFDWEFLAAVHAIEPRITLGVLGGHDARPRFDPKLLADIDALGAVMVHWNHRRLARDDVRAMRDHGLLVCVYTADDEADQARCVRDGVQFVVTNDPAQLRARVQQHGW